jgi:hypothetical protein
VGYTRRAFLVPVPRCGSFEGLNELLKERSLRRRAARLRGHAMAIGERLAADQEAFLPLPDAEFEACDKRPARVSSLSLVRYKSNDYSVPVRYGHQEVIVKGYVHEVAICRSSEEIARHKRSYEKEDFVFDPLHYLPLLETKPGALDQAAPLRGWELPEEFDSFLRLLTARLGANGKREYVQVLRLLETFRLDDVAQALRDALSLSAISFDAVKHLLLSHIEGRPARLDLALYPHLPKAWVETTKAGAYAALLTEVAR